MSYVSFSYLESSKCENDMHMLNDGIGAVISYVVSYLQDAAWVKETHISPFLTIESPLALWLLSSSD